MQLFWDKLLHNQFNNSLSAIFAALVFAGSLRPNPGKRTVRRMVPRQLDPDRMRNGLTIDPDTNPATIRDIRFFSSCVNPHFNRPVAPHLLSHGDSSPSLYSVFDCELHPSINCNCYQLIVMDVTPKAKPKVTWYNLLLLLYVGFGSISYGYSAAVIGITLGTRDSFRSIPEISLTIGFK